MAETVEQVAGLDDGRMGGTVHERVRDWLRTAISEGRWEPGTRLVQTEIALSLKVSVTPVREAMRDLQAEGLLRLDPRRGATITRVALAEVQDIRRMCELLEPLCGRLMAERITSDELDRAEEMQREMEATTDLQRYFQLNRAFHLFLQEAARSPRLSSTLMSLRDSSVGFVAVSFSQKPERHAQGLEEHRQLLRACRDRDGDAAARLSWQHWEPTFDAAEKLAR